MKERLFSFFSLFTSLGTLICCALPALMVSLGFGVVVATTISSFPWLVSLSRNKFWLFLAAGILIALNFYLVYFYHSDRGVACEVGGKDGCEVAGRFSKITLWVSAFIYCAGVFTAYVAAPVFLS